MIIAMYQAIYIFFDWLRCIFSMTISKLHISTRVVGEIDVVDLLSEHVVPAGSAHHRHVEFNHENVGNGEWFINDQFHVC